MAAVVEEVEVDKGQEQEAEEEGGERLFMEEGEKDVRRRKRQIRKK